MATHVGYTFYTYSQDFYNRIHLDPANIDVGLLYSQESYQLFIWNAYDVSKTINSITPSGSNIVISGATFPLTLGPYEYVYVTVSIDPSSQLPGSSLAIDVDGDPVISYGVDGTQAFLLPFRAQAPLKESFEWKTQVMTSYSGTEQRIKLRHSPRIGLEMTVPISFDDNPIAKNLLDGAKAKSWLAPLWHRAKTYPVINIGTLYSANTTLADVLVNDFVLIWESPKKFEVVRANASAQVKSVLYNYVNAQVVPLRVANMPDVTTRNIDGYNSVLKLKYTYSDNRYLSKSDVNITSILDGEAATTDSITSRSDVIDFETGKFEFKFPWAYNKVSRTVNVRLYNATQITQFQDFIYSRCGRLIPFDLISYEYDLIRTNVSPAANKIQVKDNFYSTQGSKYSKIGIQYGTSQTFSIHTITGVESLGSNLINLTITPNHSSDSTQSNITRICYASSKRLDTDSIELNWIENGIAECSFSIIEAL